MFVVNNRDLILDNADLYSIKTRNSYNLHLPLPHLTKYKKGVLCWNMALQSLANFHKE
jgi:hypothetical protein